MAQRGLFAEKSRPTLEKQRKKIHILEVHSLNAQEPNYLSTDCWEAGNRSQSEGIELPGFYFSVSSVQTAMPHTHTIIPDISAMEKWANQFTSQSYHGAGSVLHKVWDLAHRHCSGVCGKSPWATLTADTCQIWCPFSPCVCTESIFMPLINDKEADKAPLLSTKKAVALDSSQLKDYFSIS